jgi:hypothetical protein
VTFNQSKWAEKRHIIVKELDWKNLEQAEHFDVILASDVIWLEELVPLLTSML